MPSDYRYYEDPSDEFREEEGTLLPLWKFTYEKTKKMNVTDMCFNTLYYDLFAVCFGSRESRYNSFYIFILYFCFFHSESKNLFHHSGIPEAIARGCRLFVHREESIVSGLHQSVFIFHFPIWLYFFCDVT